MLEYLWESYHDKQGFALCGKARQTFDILHLVNTLSYDAYALAVALDLVDDQPEILSLN